jgi:uncharacterized protein YaaN involved in tellurite resistance
MSNFDEWSKLILGEMKRFDQNHRDVMKSLDKIKEEQTEQGKTLVKNTASLEEHIRRTDIAEKRIDNILVRVDETDDHVEDVRKILDKHVEDFEERLEVLEEPKVAKRYLKKFIVGAGAIAGALAAIAKLLGMF